MPVFASAIGNELWPSIAEKAYAKAHKGYAMIEGGTSGEAMRDLTGAPYYKYWLVKD
jgi:hypothetical protein